MPYGSPNGGTGGTGAGGAWSPPAGTRGIGVRSGMAQNPIFNKTKSIAYGTSDQIYSASATTAIDSPSGAIPSSIELKNNGGVPLNILIGYETYSNETTDVGATRYLHVMLMPGEVYYPSVRAVISTENAATQFDGTGLSNQVPASVMYTDSTAKTTEGFADDDDTTITFDDASGGSAGSMFKVNDLIRLDNEICRVVSLTDTIFTVERAVHGTTKTDHTNNTAIRLPFFNAYHDFDKYSVAQTDDQGRFKCFNFFGVGRATSGVQGIVPGSIAIKFYNAGYQELGLSGITSSTNSGLTAGGSYWFKIAIDGGTAESINFEVDSSNVNFGGTNGVISKIQAVLNEKYYNTAANIFEQKATVGLVGGDIRFTSGQRLATSAIALTAGADGASAAYNIFAQQNGRFKALANIDAAVVARLPDDVVYDRITYAQTPNSGAFGYDNGFGGLSGMCSGTVNYETGAIDMMSCPANAEFVYTVAHSSGFSGKLQTGANAIVEILANTPSQKWDGRIAIQAWE